MHFFVRKRRATPTVIIVALIDVLIVLLIFLMVTTSFKQQAALRLALPESTQSQKTGANEASPLVVTIDVKGIMRVGPEAKPVTDAGLLAEFLAEVGKNPDLKIAINADKGAPWGQVVKVIDASKEAKIKMINFYTKEAGK